MYASKPDDAATKTGLMIGTIVALLVVGVIVADIGSAMLDKLS
jgi:hypothetical protein